MDRYRTIISAILAALSYQYFWPGILICLIPMISYQWKKSTLFIWGLTYMACNHLFLLNLYDDTIPIIAVFLWLITSLYFSIFYGVSGLLIYKLKKVRQFNLFILLPIIWPVMEWIKTIGKFGNPNGNFGYALSNIVHLIPAYSILGNIGIGCLIICLNILLYQLVTSSKKKSVIISIFIITIMLFTLPRQSKVNSPSVNVSIIQSNIPQHKKLNRNHWPELKTYYLEAIKKSTGSLVILPETIIPTDFRQTSFFNDIQTISNNNNQYFLIGGFIRENGFYNGSYFIQPNKAPILYKKQRLMPFGESLPFRSIINKFVPSHLLFNDFDKGTELIDIPFNTTFIQPIICLEGIYSHFYNSNGIVAILANNAWFNNSSAGARLRKFAMVHATEHNAPVLLAANYGESTIINTTGQMVKLAKTNKTAILTSTIAANNTVTFYERWPYLGILLILILWWFYQRKTQSLQ